MFKKLIMKKFIFSALIAFSLFSCKKDDPAVDSGLKDYFPLEVGNKWEFEYDETIEVIGTTTISGKTYFALKGNYDTTYYRVESDKVYFINRKVSDSEKIIFKLGASKDQIWDYGEYKVKMVSKTDTITINNKKIANCYQFFFDIPVVVDDEHSIWLAPEIGFIQEQCGECLHSVRKLKKAKIGGKEIEY
jgi:hypothetical protein